METKRTGIYFGMAGLALTLSGIGCVGAPDDGSPAEEASVEMTAKLVHTVDKGNGHTLEFYDMGEGQIGVKEEYAIGDKGILADLPIGKYSLADLYRHVKPGARIPEPILGADTHAADILSKPQKIYAAVPKIAARAPTESDPNINAVQSAVTSCSADLLGDNWGAQWFVDNFCNDLLYDCGSNGFARLRHNENLRSDDWSRSGGSSFLYRHFEGDFNIAGHMEIWRVGFGLPAPVVAFSGIVSPRKVVDFTVGGGWSNQTNHASGSSGCGHDGSVVVWCSNP